MLVHSMRPQARADKTVALVLAQIKKQCVFCGQRTENAFMFKCECSICVPCLKSKLVGKHDKLVSNPYEAARRQEALVGCPNHGDAISMSILRYIFDSEKLIESSVSALRRQVKHRRLVSDVHSSGK